MAYAITNTKPTITGGHHVSEGIDGFTVYGPEKDGYYPVLAIVKKIDGGYLIESEAATIAAIGISTPTTEAGALQKYPIYETIVKTKYPPYIARKIGPKPEGNTLAGHPIVSTKPAVGWTLEKMRKMERQIVPPPVELMEVD